MGKQILMQMEREQSLVRILMGWRSHLGKHIRSQKLGIQEQMECGWRLRQMKRFPRNP